MINFPDNLIWLWISNVYYHAWETIKYYKMQYNIKNMNSWIPVHSFSCHHAHLYTEFRKMVMMTLYARQRKRHRCIEWTFGLWGRGDYLGEWHWNMYTIMWEMNRQSIFDTGHRMLGAGAWGWSREMIWEWRWEGGSGLGTHVHPWWIHVNVWQSNTVL